MASFRRPIPIGSSAESPEEVEEADSSERSISISSTLSERARWGCREDPGAAGRPRVRVRARRRAMVDRWLRIARIMGRFDTLLVPDGDEDDGGVRGARVSSAVRESVAGARGPTRCQGRCNFKSHFQKDAFYIFLLIN